MRVPKPIDQPSAGGLIRKVHGRQTGHGEGAVKVMDYEGIRGNQV